VRGAVVCLQALFQSLERLEKEKVDKEELVLEIDVVRCQSIPLLCSAGWERGRARSPLCSAIPRPRKPTEPPWPAKSAAPSLMRPWSS